MIKLIYKFSLFVVPLIFITIFKVDYSNIKNLDTILTGTIAISSSSLGFFIAGVSILQTSNMSKYYDKLVELGANKKIMGWLMTTIVYMLLLAFFSLFILFMKGIEFENIGFLMNIWLSLLFASFLATIFIVFLFAYIFTK